VSDLNDREQELGIDLMTIQIERLRQEIALRTANLFVQLAVALAAASTAGAAITLAAVANSVLAVIIGVIVAHLIPMH
jgi:hypothetical protein